MTTAVVHDIEIDDDRNLIQPGDPVLLIVEDDITFARILLELAHDRGIKGPGGAARSNGAEPGTRVRARARSRWTSLCRTWLDGLYWTD